jgi:hypothetical protein
MNKTSRHSPKHPRRGAALYAMVMITALLCSVLGLAGLTVVRLERQQMQSSTDVLDARQNARSGVELALRVIANDPNWRTNLTNGGESALQSIGASGTGTVSWMIEDLDLDLTDSDTELRIHGIGRVGNVVQVSSLQVDGSLPTVLDSLLCATYAVGNVTQSSNSTSNGGPFASAATLTVNGTVYGNAEGTPVVVSGSVTGVVTNPGPGRTMPDPSVWDTYMALATTIPYTNFPVDPAAPNKRTIERELLSGSVNPYGTVDADGVYYIQIPSGKQLTASKSRLHCTLLIELIGTGSFDTVQSCLWDPFNGNNYPCAIVKGTGAGDFQLKSSAATLKEQQTPKKNFNPPGDPYDGESDTDESDARVPTMRGLFHVIGSGVHSTLASNLVIEGVFITEGSMTLGANLSVTVAPNLYSNPPVGYTAGGGTPGPDLIVLPGTWLSEAAA